MPARLAGSAGAGAGGAPAGNVRSGRDALRGRRQGAGADTLAVTGAAAGADYTGYRCLLERQLS